MSGAGLASQRELCLPGLTGVFCKLCKDENNTYYRKATSERVASCEACKDTLAQTIGIGIGGLLGALVLVTLLYRWWHRLPAMRKAKEQLFRVQDTYTLQNKGKIIIGFYMIASKLDNVYELRMPEEVRDVYLAVSRVLTLGIEWGLELTPLECFGLGAEVRGIALRAPPPPLPHQPATTARKQRPRAAISMNAELCCALHVCGVCACHPSGLCWRDGVLADRAVRS